MNGVKVAVIGAGVIGQAIIRVLIESGSKPSDITVREKIASKEAEVCKKYGIGNGSIAHSEIVILAIKPQDLNIVATEIESEIEKSTLIISFLAGTKINKIQTLLGNELRVIRVMPNTPLVFGEGMSAIAKGAKAMDSDLNMVTEILGNFGETLVIPEDLVDSVTAVSGSGPAYFLYLAESMIEAAQKLGLSREMSKLLVFQTLYGTAKMLKESGKDANSLRREVTSPNGTTAAAIASFEASGLEEVIYKAMKAARDRSEEIGN